MPSAAPVRSTTYLRSPAVLGWLRMRRVDHQVSRVVNAPLLQAGLTLGQFGVLAHVGANEGVSQQELADWLAVTEGNVCQLVSRMVEAGLLVREQDGRSKRLFLTEEGRRLRAQVLPVHEGLIAEQFSALSAAEQVQLLRLLRKLDRATRG